MDGTENVGFLSGTIFFLFLTFIGIITVVSSRTSEHNQRFQVNLFVTAFVLRYLMSLAIYQFGLIRLIKDEDGSGWVLGILIQQSWVDQGSGIFAIPVNWISAFSEHHRDIIIYWPPYTCSWSPLAFPPPRSMDLSVR